jgi:hypothetical protein
VTAEVANTTISVLRGTTTSALGDVIPTGEAVITGVPAFIGETGRKVQDPSTETPRTIRQVAGQVPGWCGIQNTDQILDERTGDTYIILSVTQPPALFGRREDWNQVLDLKRVTAAGT